MAITLTEVDNGIQSAEGSIENRNGVFKGGSRTFCADPGGNLFWFAYARDKPAGTWRMRVIYSTDFGANWTEDSLLTLTSSSREHVMKIDSSGGLHIVYLDNPGSPQIFYIKRISPNNWTTPIGIGDGTKIALAAGSLISSLSNHLDMAVTSDGKVHVTYTGTDVSGTANTNRPFYITNESGSFVTTRLSTDSTSSTNISWGFGHAIMADRNDKLHLMAGVRRVATDRLEYISKASGAAWGNWDSGSINVNFEVVYAFPTQSLATSNWPSIDVDTGSGVFIGHTEQTSAPKVAHFRRNSFANWTRTEAFLAPSGAYTVSSTSIAIAQDGTHYVFYATDQVGTFPTKMQIAYHSFIPGVTTPSSQILITDNDHHHSTLGQTGPMSLHHLLPYLGAPFGIPGVGFAGFFHEDTNPSKLFFFISTDFEFASAADLVTEGPPSCPAEPDRASKVFAGEGSASLTYPLAPDFIFGESDRFSTINVRTDHGYDVTFPKRATTRRRWRIEHRNITKTQRDTIMAFIEARSGPVDAFNFTHPETGATIKVHVLTQTVESIKSQPNVYTIRADFEELF